MNPNLQETYAIAAQPQGFALRDLLEILREARWLIAGTIAVFFLIGLAAIFIRPPEYRSETLLEIPIEHSGTGFLNESSTLSRLFGTTNINTELEILESNLLLAPVVDNLKLDIITTPNYFPVFGAAIAHHFDNAGNILRSWPGLKEYAWGGEKLVLDRLDIPEQFYNLEFIIQTAENGRYYILDSEGELLSEAVVGTAATNWLPTNKPHSMQISELQAPPKTQFRVRRVRKQDAVFLLKQTMDIVQKGNKERKESTAIVLIVVEGPDKEKVGAINENVVAAYISQDLDRVTDTVEGLIGTLKKQLATVSSMIKDADSRLSDYRSTHNPVSLNLESQVLLDKMVTEENLISQLQQERDQLALLYAPQHPDYYRIEEIDDQINSHRETLGRLQSRSRSLPKSQQTVLNMTRDREVTTNLYTQLLNQIQELDLYNNNKSERIRVVDHTMEPFNVQKAQNVVIMTIYLLLGSLLGISMAFVKNHFKDVIDDPDQLENKLGYPVYAVVPRSLKQKNISRKIKSNKQEGSSNILATQHSEEPAVESLRGLRTSIHFALLDAKNNLLLITGPAPGVGKSFISINLCVLLANAGRKILLIDADMRKGLAHKHFGMLERGKLGISDVVANSAIDIEDVIIHTDVENLDFIPAGTYPPNPSELLSHQRFATALEQISQEYNHVVIDSPPVLPVTDAAIIGPLAGATLLVVKAGSHSMREVEESIKRLRQVGTNLRGIVFNDFQVAGKHLKYSKYYGYSYKYSSKS